MRVARMLVLAMGIGTLVGAQVAQAAQVYDPVYEDDYDRDYEKPKHLFSQWGMSVTAGGGVAGFTDDRMRSMTDTGASWDARFVVGTRSPVGFEIGYLGTVQGIETLGIDTDAGIMSNGVAGALRFNILTGMWQPYVAAGVGYRQFGEGIDAVDMRAVDTGGGEAPEFDDIVDAL